MDIRNDIIEIKRIIEEKIVDINYVFKRLESLYSKIISDFFPKEQLDKAANYISSWLKQLMKESYEERQKETQFINEINELVRNAKSDFKKMSKGQKPDTKLDSWDEETLTKLDYSKSTKLLEKAELIGDLYNLQIRTKQELYQVKLVFGTIKSIIILVKGIIFLSGVVISYYLGLYLEKSIAFNPLIVTIIGSLFCYFSLDKLLEKYKSKILWHFASNTFLMLCNSIVEFIKLRDEFRLFLKDNPEIS